MFGVISSPFLLHATIKYHLQNRNSPISHQIHNNLYVDNLVTGTNDLETALSLYKKAKIAFNQLSMNLRAWNSNNKEFMSAIARKDKTEQKSHIVHILG